MNTLRYISAQLLCAFVWLCSAQAQDGLAPGAQPQISTMQRLAQMAPMFLMVFLIFYLLVLLPQKKQAKMQAALLDSLKKGDMVLTSSGILARVAGVEKDHILLEISTGVKVKFERSHVKMRIEKKD